jgi:hypothetical protein
MNRILVAIGSYALLGFARPAASEEQTQPLSALATVAWSAAALEPEHLVADAWVDAPAEAGHGVVLEWTVRRSHAATGASGRLRFRVDGQDWDEVKGLAPGELARLRLEVSDEVAADGRIHLQATLDARGGRAGCGPTDAGAWELEPVTVWTQGADAVWQAVARAPRVSLWLGQDAAVSRAGTAVRAAAAVSAWVSPRPVQVVLAREGEPATLALGGGGPAASATLDGSNVAAALQELEARVKRRTHGNTALAASRWAAPRVMLSALGVGDIEHRGGGAVVRRVVFPPLAPAAVKAGDVLVLHLAVADSIRATSSVRVSLAGVELGALGMRMGKHQDVYRELVISEAAAAAVQGAGDQPVPLDLHIAHRLDDVQRHCESKAQRAWTVVRSDSHFRRARGLSQALVATLPPGMPDDGIDGALVWVSEWARHAPWAAPGIWVSEPPALHGQPTEAEQLFALGDAQAATLSAAEARAACGDGAYVWSHPAPGGGLPGVWVRGAPSALQQAYEQWRGAEAPLGCVHLLAPLPEQAAVEAEAPQSTGGFGSRSRNGAVFLAAAALLYLWWQGQKRGKERDGALAQRRHTFLAKLQASQKSAAPPSDDANEPTAESDSAPPA